MKPKNNYQRYIAEYEKRKERQEKILKNIRRRLKTWKDQIRRIEKKEKLLKDIHMIVTGYFGTTKGVRSISRSVFCKYCIEQGINGKFVAYFLKSHPSSPARARRIFTRSFKNNPSRSALYSDFLNYIKVNGLPSLRQGSRIKAVNRK